MKIFTLPDNTPLIVGDKEYVVLEALTKAKVPLDNTALAKLADTTPRAVNVMIHNLRSKLRKEKTSHVIHNITGSGYIFTTKEANPT